MVGIVAVSHSAVLLEGLRELVEQMAGDRPLVAYAGGIDDESQPIGTDAIKILNAIQSVYSSDGVLVIMDMGSAILSSESAIEMLPAEMQENVQMCPAPIVEGTLAAVIQASSGSSMDDVRKEALESLVPKNELVEPPKSNTDTVSTDDRAPTATGSITIKLTVLNPMGLHARPAANFVRTSNQFSSDIEVVKSDKWVSGKSVNQLASLGVRFGENISVTITGSDAREAAEALQTLADDYFGESAEEREKQEDIIYLSESEEETIDPACNKGLRISDGVAIATPLILDYALPKIPTRVSECADTEIEKFHKAIGVAKSELDHIVNATEKMIGKNEGEIFKVHKLILEDSFFQDDVETTIINQKVGVENALVHAINAVVEDYKNSDNKFLQNRAGDVYDAGRRVLAQFIDLNDIMVDVSEPCIVVAKDIPPSAVRVMDDENIVGICLENCSPNSHSAILLRAIGKPVITNAQNAVEKAEYASSIAINCITEEIFFDPDRETSTQLELLRKQYLERKKRILEMTHAESITKDGVRVAVSANIERAQDARNACSAGAEGVGLFRTEFLFINAMSEPSESEQFKVYSTTAENTDKEHDIIIRTLDIGADKPVPYVRAEAEANPFLGYRGIRLCLGNVELFKTQLRGILRASGEHENIKIMYPMISTIDEVFAADKILDEAKEELRRENIPFNKDIKRGIMIEVPSSVIDSECFGKYVDFFSIGTNDLAQYTMAADRGNKNVTHLIDNYSPVLMRSIKMAVNGALKNNIEVGICGELAGESLLTPVLIGLGITKLSMSAPLIPEVKAAVQMITYSKAKEIADNVLKMSGSKDVREYLKQHAPI